MFKRNFLFAPEAENGGGEPQSLEAAIALRTAAGDNDAGAQAFFDAAPAEGGEPVVPVVAPVVPAPAADATTIVTPAAPTVEPFVNPYLTPVEPVVPAAGAEGVPPTPGEPVEPVVPQVLQPWTSQDGTVIDPAEVQAALVVARGLRTESGVKMMVAKGLQAMGKDAATVQAFLDGKLTEQQAAVAPVEQPKIPDILESLGLGDDDVVDTQTLRQVIAQVQADATKAALEAAGVAVAPVITEQEQRRNAGARDAVDNTLIQLLGTNGDPKTVDVPTANLVVERAQRYIDPTNWDPAHIRDAVLRGHADLVNDLDHAQQTRLTRLAGVAATVPSTIGTGTPPGGEPLAEPQSFEEAMAQARVLEPGLFK